MCIVEYMKFYKDAATLTKEIDTFSIKALCASTKLSPFFSKVFADLLKNGLILMGK